MAKYKLTENGVKDTETNMFIPNSGGNRHWQEYLAWAAEGNTADDEFTSEEITSIAWDSLRNERNILLKTTDFMMTVDFYNNMTVQEQSDVTSYRTALRDLPANVSDPTNFTWPTQPQIVIDNL